MTGRRGMTFAEAAEEIVREAREVLGRDMAVGEGAAAGDLRWGNSMNGTVTTATWMNLLEPEV